MGEIYLPTLQIGPVDVPGHTYRDLGLVENIPPIVRALALFHACSSASAIGYAHRSRNAVGHHLAIEENGKTFLYTMYRAMGDPIQDVFTKAHEETHVAQTAGLLYFVEQQGRKFGLHRCLDNSLDTELLADIGGLIGLFLNGIDPRVYEREVVDRLFTKDRVTDSES